MIKNIAILICYFGKLPWYFKYFIHSCAYNYRVDFFIITDENLSSLNLPANIVVINKTLTDITSIAQKKLKMPIGICNPYKLCDFKPAYGFIFSELIAGYKFFRSYTKFHRIIFKQLLRGRKEMPERPCTATAGLYIRRAVTAFTG